MIPLPGGRVYTMPITRTAGVESVDKGKLIERWGRKITGLRFSALILADKYDGWTAALAIAVHVKS